MSIPSFLKKDKDSILFNGEGEFVFYVPELYFRSNHAIVIGEYVNLIGILDYSVFDKNGNTVESGFNDRIIGLSLDDLKKIPNRVCIIYDDYKVPAVKTALKTGLVNVLITDDNIAEQLLLD